jgi:CheY-like chemotaxis protein
LRLLLEEELHPDLILLDLMMPVMDGWAFRAEQAKNLRLESIPVVLFSAYALQPDVVDRMKVAGFLRKPMSLRALLDTVERFATAASS